MTEKSTTYLVIWPGHLWIGGVLLFGIGVMVGLAVGVLL